MSRIRQKRFNGIENGVVIAENKQKHTAAYPRYNQRAGGKRAYQRQQNIARGGHIRAEVCFAQGGNKAYADHCGKGNKHGKDIPLGKTVFKSVLAKLGQSAEHKPRKQHYCGEGGDLEKLCKRIEYYAYCAYCAQRDWQQIQKAVFKVLFKAAYCCYQLVVDI